MQKVIGLMGYVDKSEFILNLSKILDIMGKKVLVVDGTIEQKVKYTIPSFDTAAVETITHFDGTDYAVGFKSIEDIKTYICTKTSNAEEYDYILLNIDNASSYEYYKSLEITKYYFFIDYTTSSLIRNEELVRKMTEERDPENKIELVKVIFKYYVSRATDKYFENRLRDMNVKWIDEEFELPYNDQDRIANLESELSGYLDFSRHTKQYMNLITDMAAEILGQISAGEIRKSIKQYSRRKF